MFDPRKMDVGEHIDLIDTLGNMLGQKDESKKDKFIDTMPMIIQTHLITQKDWAVTTKKAKELEHIIRKCDPLTAALSTLAKDTAVPGLYSHIAHSNDKAEIPQPFKGAHPKQPKPRGGGKGKQPQQKLKNPPPQTQDDQYNYEDTNNYYHNENYRGQSRGRRPYRGQNTGQNFHGTGQRNQNTYQGQYQNDGYQSNNYQGNRGFYHNPSRNFPQGKSYGQFRGRSHG